MSSVPQNVFRDIEAELHALRQAIVTNDLESIRQHTAATSKTLSSLTLQLSASDLKHPSRELIALQSAAGAVDSLLRRATRTVQALLAVYRSFSHSATHVFMEPH